MEGRPHYVVSPAGEAPELRMVKSCRTMVRSALRAQAAGEEPQIHPSTEFVTEVIDFALEAANATRPNQRLVDMKLSEQKPFAAYSPVYSPERQRQEQARQQAQQAEQVEREEEDERLRKAMDQALLNEDFFAELNVPEPAQRMGQFNLGDFEGNFIHMRV